MSTNAAPFLTISVSSKLEQWWVQNHYWFSTALTMYHTEGHNHHHDNHAGDGENFQLLEYAVLSSSSYCTVLQCRHKKSEVVKWKVEPNLREIPHCRELPAAFESCITACSYCFPHMARPVQAPQISS